MMKKIPHLTTETSTNLAFSFQLKLIHQWMHILYFQPCDQNANDRFLESFWLIVCDMLIFQEGSDALSLTLGIAAATGLGLLAFSEVEILRLGLSL